MPLLFTCNDEIRQYGDHSAVHCHRHRHFIQWNSIEQDFHVLNAVDCNARFTDIANHAFMITVVSAVCRQIKGHGNTLLTRCQGTTVKRV